MSVTERPRALPGPLTAQPAPPSRLYSFTDWQTNNPTAPPPGDRMDADYDNTNTALSQTLSWAATSLNTDGTLKAGTVGQSQMVSGLFDDIAQDIIDEVQPLVDQASGSATAAAAHESSAWVASDQSVNANLAAQAAATTASAAATTAVAARNTAQTYATTAQTAATNASNADNHAEGAAALAQDYADVTQAWAEHMPDTIPPNILAVMGITGDHWSSRWWAHQAALNAGLSTSTVAISDTPPIEPVCGQLWFDSSSPQLYVYYCDPNSSEWVIAAGGAGASAGSKGFWFYLPNFLPAGQPDGGTTDLTPYIQMAIDTAAGHGALIIPANINPYLIHSTLLVRSNSHLIIEAGATIKIASGANCNGLAFPFTPGLSPVTTPSVTNVVIELYGTLDGNRKGLDGSNPTGNTAGNGIGTLGGANSVLNRCANIYVFGGKQGKVINWANSGIAITNCTNSEINGVTVDSCGNSIGYNGDDNALPNDVAYSYNVGLSDCTISNINDLGCGLYGGVQRGFVRNCDISGCVGGGAFIYSDTAQTLPNSDCEITGCTLHDNPASGAEIVSNMLTTYHTNCVVRGNRIFNNAGAGITISQVIGALVEGNFVHDNIYKNARFSRLNMAADIVIGHSASSVSIIGNLILNPMVGCTNGTGYGIAMDAPNYCHIMGNRIADLQTTMSMTAAIGGNWGSNGTCIGNSYGRRINTVGNFPADLSLYQTGSVQGINYDTVAGYISGLTQLDDINGQTNFPPKGLTVGINYDGRNEVDFLIGADGQSPLPGGFDFIKTHWPNVHVNSGTNSGGNISLTTNTAHGINVGDLFNVSAASGVGGDIAHVNGKFIAAAGTGGTTLNYTIAAVLDVQSITGGNINHMILDGGVIDTTAGVNGSLLANDGFGNTRLGGALVHGAMQTVASLVNAGTVTVSANTSMVLIRNSASIATASVVLPAPTASSYVAGSELELNFQNPIGALTWSGAAASGAPTAITQAGASVSFINSGTTWLRRIAT
jgi:hypothetical protein